MEPHRDYLSRLADIDAKVERARVDPEVVLGRAAGLLAGRTGCRVDEAHAHLLRLAAERGDDPGETAADVLEALEDCTPQKPDRLGSLTETALRPPPPAGRRSSPGSFPSSGPAAPSGVPSVVSGWADIVQQVLDAVPGRHIVLMPVRDRNGRIEDYTFAAASPSVVDLSGRRGTQIVGRRVSETYPTLVNGPIWEAWGESIADGLSREVGPVPYASPAERAPVDVTLTVRVRPVGLGLLNSWVRHDEEDRLAERIAQTEQLGNLGWGEWDLLTGKIVWSEGLYRIYERDPAEGPLPSEESDALTVPEDIPLRQQAVEIFGRGETVDVSYRIRVGDRIKHIRTIVDAVRDTDGRPVKVYGIVQDVTARETSRVRLAEVEQQLREHQRSLAAEHRLTVQLQQIVLPIPAAPFDLPGLRAAVRYLPAETASRVGGDWYHAAAADDGSVVLAVGDVAGHGLQAAAVMAQLRHALAALSVTTTSDPAALLTHLNQLLYAGRSAADLMPLTATAVVARYDPPTGTLVWAQAGHPAPLRARAGVTTELDRPEGALLGAFPEVRYGTAAATVVPGDLLLFYTDGLIEHRDRTLEEGLAPVLVTLNRLSGERNQQPLAELLAQLRHANPDDDACILAVRPLPVASDPGGDDG
ncbi:hypothetical protein Plo01_52950 [Planobispora longispora]|uniref:Uncharacterized protein n=1 Tax=Planobispora longispora TaxID=28887 RepID=A0A8J3RLP3_9ACTN|nr:PP2C family protein-serine/threonine phosphatase [Planobispora longispora]GIH78866.1 hypothetical protein Plo01_52950 [Planobispora longispora]